MFFRGGVAEVERRKPGTDGRESFPASRIGRASVAPVYDRVVVGLDLDDCHRAALGIAENLEGIVGLRSNQDRTIWVRADDHLVAPAKERALLRLFLFVSTVAAVAVAVAVLGFLDRDVIRAVAGAGHRDDGVTLVVDLNGQPIASLEGAVTASIELEPLMLCACTGLGTVGAAGAGGAEDASVVLVAESKTTT